MTESRSQRKKDAFVMLPRWLYDSKFLTTRDKWLCLAMASFRNNLTKRCFPSRETLCRKAGCAELTYYKCRNRLKKIGLIDYEDCSGGRKHSAEFVLKWLDGSEPEIERLKAYLRTGGTTSINDRSDHPSRTQAKHRSRTQAKHPKRTHITTKNRNQDEWEQQQEDGEVATFLSKFPNLKTILSNWGLGDKKIEVITRIILDNKGGKPNEYLEDWIKYLGKKPTTYNRAGYLIAMVEQGIDPPKKTESSPELQSQEIRKNTREQQGEGRGSIVLTKERIEEDKKRLQKLKDSVLQKDRKGLDGAQVT